ncbi:MAG: amidase family protein, partial [Geminicoccaceae bacterium]
MDLDLVTLTERLARRDVSALEVTDYCLERIERLDPSLNAFRQIQADHARDQAKSSDRRRRRVGLLDGVPVA